MSDEGKTVFRQSSRTAPMNLGIDSSKSYSLNIVGFGGEHSRMSVQSLPLVFI